MFTEQDKSFIEKLGLQRLSEEQQAKQLQSFYATLKLRVGMVLEEKLSDEQLIEFEKISESGDQEAITAWLTKAVPDYDQVMATEMEALVQEIKQTAADLRSIIDEAND